MRGGRFTDEELQVCRDTNIVSVCRQLGFHVKEGPIYSMITEIDSIRIKNKKTFVRYSNNAHGSAIDFLMEVQGMEWKEAVEWLLDFNGVSRDNREFLSDVSELKSLFTWFTVSISSEGDVVVTKKNKLQPKYQAPKEETEKVEFKLPDKTDPVRLKAYMTKQRMIDERIVDLLLERNLIYESEKTHNVVFVGCDKDGVPRHASMRGTYTREGQKPYKGVATGSDSRFSFNMVNEKSNCLAVFEAPIDAITFFEAMQDNGEFNILALTGIHDRALEQFLNDHPNINEVMLCLDNDEAGNTACEKLIEKYSSEDWKKRNLVIYRDPPFENFKDWNEMWVDWKKNNNGVTI